MQGVPVQIVFEHGPAGIDHRLVSSSFDLIAKCLADLGVCCLAVAPCPGGVESAAPLPVKSYRQIDTGLVIRQQIDGLLCLFSGFLFALGLRIVISTYSEPCSMSVLNVLLVAGVGETEEGCPSGVSHPDDHMCDAMLVFQLLKLAPGDFTLPVGDVEGLINIVARLVS